MLHLHFLAAGVVCDACLCKSSLGTCGVRIHSWRKGHDHRAHVPLALEIRRTLHQLLDERALVKVDNDTRVDPETLGHGVGKETVLRDRGCNAGYNEEINNIYHDKLLATVGKYTGVRDAWEGKQEQLTKDWEHDKLKRDYGNMSVSDKRKYDRDWRRDISKEL
jgi:hypothetical protein